MRVTDLLKNVLSRLNYNNLMTLSHTCEEVVVLRLRDVVRAG
jgi:hypothetical protein